MSKRNLKEMIKWRDKRIDELEFIIKEINQINSSDKKKLEKKAMISLKCILEPSNILMSESGVIISR